MRVIYVDEEYEYGLTYLCLYLGEDGTCTYPFIDVIGRTTQMSDVIKEKLLAMVTGLCVSPSQFVDIDGEGRPIRKSLLLLIK